MTSVTGNLVSLMGDGVGKENGGEAKLVVQSRESGDQ